LDDLRLARLKAELHDLLHHEEDQVLFVSLGPSSADASLIIDAMGLPYQVRSRVTII
jgi:CRISPR-associated protein Cas2